MLFCSSAHLFGSFSYLFSQLRFSVFQFVFTFVCFRFSPALETEPATFGIFSYFLKVASDVFGFSFRRITSFIIELFR